MNQLHIPQSTEQRGECSLPYSQKYTTGPHTNPDHPRTEHLKLYQTSSEHLQSKEISPFSLCNGISKDTFPHVLFVQNRFHDTTRLLWNSYFLKFAVVAIFHASLLVSEYHAMSLLWRNCIQIDHLRNIRRIFFTIQASYFSKYFRFLLSHMKRPYFVGLTLSLQFSGISELHCMKTNTMFPGNEYV